MELGLYTFANIGRDTETGRRIAPEVRMRHLLEEIALAPTRWVSTSSALVNTIVPITGSRRRL